MTRRLLAWAPAAAWAALIFWLSSQPTLPGPSFTASDKVFHFGAYFVLGMGLSIAGLRPGPAFALGALYGASDEFHQSFVPGRSADPLDWAADAAGVAAAVFLHHRWRSWRERRVAAPGGAAHADS